MTQAEDDVGRHAHAGAGALAPPRGGPTTRYIFDARGAPRAQGDAGEDAVGVTRVDHPIPPEQTFDLLTVTGITSRTQWNGAATTTTVTAGQVVTTTPGGRTITTTIDAHGRPQAVALPGLPVVTVAYDGDRPTAISQGGRTVTFGYDQAFVSSVVDPLNRTVSLPRDANGWPQSRQDFGVQQFDYSYDANGNPTDTSSPQSGGYHEPAGYSPVDLVTSFTRPAGQFTIAYDADRKPTGGSSPYSGGGLEFDGEGRLTQIGPIAYGYDGDGYLTSIASPDGSITYGYGASAAPTSISMEGAVQGTVTIGRNDRFQATSISVGAAAATLDVDADGVVSRAGALQIARNAASAITGTTVDNVTDRYVRNQFGEPLAYVVRHGTSELFREEYLRDRGGRIRAKAVRIRHPVSGLLEAYTAAYDYDVPGRLQTVTYNDGEPVHYGYDANNNLIGAPAVAPTPAPGPVRLYLHAAAPVATPAEVVGGWSDTAASALAAMGRTADGVLTTTTVEADDCAAAGTARRLLATVFVSPPLAAPHVFTGTELFSLVIGAAAEAPDDHLEPLASVWVMNGSTGAMRCAIATDAAFATSGDLAVGAARGIEGQVAVADGAEGCMGHAAHASDRIVVEVGFACTAASVAPVRARVARGGDGAALGAGDAAEAGAGSCDPPGYLQVDGGLRFEGAATATPCDPPATTIDIHSRRLQRVTVNAENQAIEATLVDPEGQTRHYRYAYDPRGALASQVELDAAQGAPIAAPTTYDYDERGNLRHVALPDGTTIAYLIDAANRRVGRTVTTAQGATTQRFLYQSALRIAAEVDEAGAPITFFVYGDKPNVPEYLERGGQRYRLVSDHLGSVRLVVDTENGEIHQRRLRRARKHPGGYESGISAVWICGGTIRSNDPASSFFS